MHAGSEDTFEHCLKRSFMGGRSAGKGHALSVLKRVGVCCRYLSTRRLATEVVRSFFFELPVLTSDGNRSKLDKVKLSLG